MGERLERYLPAEERVTALWLAGALVVLELLKLLNFEFPGIRAAEHPVRNDIAVALVYVGLVVVLLWLARTRLGAPPGIVGGTLVFAAAIAVMRLVSVVFFALGLLVSSEPRYSARWILRTFVMPEAGPILLLALGLVVLLVHGLVTSGDEDDGSARGDLTGLGRHADVMGRGLALGAGGVALASALAASLVYAALALLLRAIPGDPPASLSWAVFAVRAVSHPLAIFLVVLFALERLRVARSVWLPLAAYLVTRTLLSTASLLGHFLAGSAVPMGLRADLVALFWAGGPSIVVCVLDVLAMLLAVRIDTGRVPPPSAEESASAA